MSAATTAPPWARARVPHWTEGRPCVACRRLDRRCECGPWCTYCGAGIGHWKGRPEPERCGICLFELPSSFAGLPPNRPGLVDDRVAELRRGVEWWQGLRGNIARGDHAGLPWLVVRIAREIDQGRDSTAPGWVLKAAAGEQPGRAVLDARVLCAMFLDDVERSHDLLVGAWLTYRAVAVARSEELELRSAEATDFLADAIARFSAPPTPATSPLEPCPTCRARVGVVESCQVCRGTGLTPAPTPAATPDAPPPDTGPAP
jgi:hypothetical protein